MIESPTMADELRGRHPLSLQWISWDDFGRATVRKVAGTYVLSGEQRSIESSDYLKIDGSVTRITDTSFFFEGTIEIRVSFINGGEPYRREGEQEFRLYGNRRFWRLVAMDNGFGSVDYVDIFFDHEAAEATPSY